MTVNGRDRLYKLLPAIYRIRDAGQGLPLGNLLEIIGDEIDAIQADIDGMYDDWFIETCADWVVPYIGDLVANTPLHEIAQLRRTDVARTIWYRRRKGTAAMLEQMARDVTGWGAHVVEFFKLLEWSQNLNHLRFKMSPNPEPGSPPSSDFVGTVNLRSMDVVDRLDGPFDVLSHTVDVRPISDTKGWYNIPKIGFFLWRLRPYPLARVSPRPVKGHTHCFTASRLGNQAPLFNKPQPVERALSDEVSAPGPIRPMAFDLDLKHFRREAPPESADSDYYGPERGLNIIKNGQAVSPKDIIPMDLGCFERPPQGKVGIDVRRGLISFASGEEPVDAKDITKFNMSYTYGFSADAGGGPYERRNYEIKPPSGAKEIHVRKDAQAAQADEDPPVVDSLQTALKNWSDSGRNPTVIRILDNGDYPGKLDIALPDKGRLQIIAENGCWPHVFPTGLFNAGVAAGQATLVLDGLLIEGALQLSGALDLKLRDCTIVPGRSLALQGNAIYPALNSLTVKNSSSDLTVEFTRCITGPIRMPADSKLLTIQDSIVQATPGKGGKVRCAIAANDAGDEPGPPAVIERCTIYGPVHVKELALASETIFVDVVKARRQQEGCVRFCYVPELSIVPRRYRCQPDLALDREAARLNRSLTNREKQLVIARVHPHFTSRHYGDPGYTQLTRSTHKGIRQGAADESEMGAFCSLKQPQREANLRIRLKEYLPFGLEAGLIFVT